MVTLTIVCANWVPNFKGGLFLNSLQGRKQNGRRGNSTFCITCSVKLDLWKSPTIEIKSCRTLKRIRVCHYLDSSVIFHENRGDIRTARLNKWEREGERKRERGEGGRERERGGEGGRVFSRLSKENKRKTNTKTHILVQVNIFAFLEMTSELEWCLNSEGIID